MLERPEESIESRPSLPPSGELASLRLDTVLSGLGWVFVRGRLTGAGEQHARNWLFRRRPSLPLAARARLEMVLPGDPVPRDVPLGARGEFETRLPARPRLLGAPARIHATVLLPNSRQTHVRPLYVPPRGARLGVLVLLPPSGWHSSASPGLSSTSRLLVSLLARDETGTTRNPVFFLGSLTAAHRSAAAHVDAWPDAPEGADIPGVGGTASETPGERARWIERLLNLYGPEFPCAIIGDTSRETILVLRAFRRIGARSDRLRAVFLSDTRPVARGVLRQSSQPGELAGLDLPLLMCRTLDEARRTVAASGLAAAAVASDPATYGTRLGSPAHARVTRSPLVFCHGMLGYSVLRLHRVDLDNYFSGLHEYFTQRGFHVLMPQLGRTHGIRQRAEQLRQVIGRWTSGPVNIIAHSMGGLDARFMVSQLDMAGRVASVTTVGTPHHGTYIADWFVEHFDARFPLLRGLERFGADIDGFRDVTRAACRSFNAAVPDAPGVRYLSYSAFQVAGKIPPILRRSHSLIARIEGANDGLVSQASARWGEHRLTLRSDHLSLVGERGPEFFDHLAFYQRLADDLIRMGF
jgi:triacylglycerol lipase